MNFYIVMQGKTYEQEAEYGIICSEIYNKKGETPHFWARMKQVQPGDVIFHYVRGEMVAVSKATSYYREDFIPYRLNTRGYIVQTNYIPFKTSVNVKANFHEIAPHLPVKYAAFQPNADGNQGYIFPCNELLALSFLKLASDANLHSQQAEQLEIAMSAIIQKERDELAAIISQSLHYCETAVSIAKKVHHHSLRTKWANKCAVCQLDVPELLIGTYSKAFKDCSETERIDEMNGILLCANHHALYERGLISFNGSGKIHLSSKLTEEQLTQLLLKPTLKIARDEANKPYYKWHKKWYFQ